MCVCVCVPRRAQVPGGGGAGQHAWIVKQLRYLGGGGAGQHDWIVRQLRYLGRVPRIACLDCYTAQVSGGCPG